MTGRLIEVIRLQATVTGPAQDREQTNQMSGWSPVGGQPGCVTDGPVPSPNSKDMTIIFYVS